MTAIDIVVTVAGAIGFGFALVRWLRVAQREHYHFGCRDPVRSPLVGLDQPERRARVRRGVHRRTRVRVADHGSGHRRGSR